ncbi:hypothetical protein BS47DRAFT_1269058, partial [Hydnum rufescens UP504]
RKHVQAACWSQTVLLILIRPFMHWKREQASSHRSPSFPECGIVNVCSCMMHHRTLKVVCVSIKALYNIELSLCNHSCSAPEQLMEIGYFPCTPVYPMLAVSLDMLELVSILFVHSAPNERAWAATITKYL